MSKLKYPHNITKNRASLNDMKHISFDLSSIRKIVRTPDRRAIDKLVGRIQDRFDKIALRMLNTVRKEDRK